MAEEKNNNAGGGRGRSQVLVQDDERCHGIDELHRIIERRRRVGVAVGDGRKTKVGSGHDCSQN